MTTGSQVVSDNAQGSATPGFFSGVLGELTRGVRGFIEYLPGPYAWRAVEAATMHFWPKPWRCRPKSSPLSPSRPTSFGDTSDSRPSR